MGASKVFQVCLTASLLVGLVAATIAQAQKPPPTTTDRIAELEDRLKFLQNQLTSLQSRVAYGFASLDCNTRKYDEFQFDSSKLVFFASCQKIEPYLEGHRITLHIGNPYAFNFSSIKGKLGYGKDILDAFSKKIEVSTPDSIRAGTWHVLTVIINPSKAEEMRNLILELSAETASPGLR